MKNKWFHKRVTEEQQAKALKWGLSKFITILLQLTEANYRKAKKYIIELWGRQG